MSEGRLPRSGLSMRLPGLLVAAALAIGLLAVFAGSASRQAGAQACTGQFAIDFAGLPAGTIIGEQYAGSGVHISGAANHGGPNALIVFDSNSTNTDLDADLRVGIGNIAIFALNLTDVAPADGLVDRPDENNYGGRASFSFDQDVSIGSFKFVDKDHEPDDFAIAYDASGNVVKQAAISPAGNGSVQTIAIDADGVRRFEVVYGDSGGFTGIEVDCGQPGPTPTPTAVPATAAPTSPPDTPSPEAGTPTPTEAAATPTPAPTESAAATPTAAAAEFTPSAGQPAQGVAVAAETAGRPQTAVLGAEALPAGGASPASGGSFEWALLLFPLALVLGGSAIWMFKARR